MANEFHDLFAAALKSGDDRAFAAYLTDPAALKRFAVYRNNVVRGAIEALRAAYPAVDRIVGDQFFAPLAKAFWEYNPPTERSLSLYGAGFADFITRYAPAQSLPYLPDIARLDRAWLLAHHAAEAGPVTPERVGAMETADLPALELTLHPSVQLVETAHDAYPAWRANRAAGETGRQSIGAGPAFTLMWRQRGEVRHRALTLGHYAFLSAFKTPERLDAAAEAGLTLQPDFDPAGAFGRGLVDEIFIR